jgi:hypothetical protein
MDSKNLNNTKDDRPNFQVINQSAINEFLWSIKYPNRVNQPQVTLDNLDELKLRQEDRQTGGQKKE